MLLNGGALDYGSINGQSSDTRVYTGASADIALTAVATTVVNRFAKTNIEIPISVTSSGTRQALGTAPAISIQSDATSFAIRAVKPNAASNLQVSVLSQAVRTVYASGKADVALGALAQAVRFAYAQGTTGIAIISNSQAVRTVYANGEADLDFISTALSLRTTLPVLTDPVPDSRAFIAEGFMRSIDVYPQNRTFDA